MTDEEQTALNAENQTENTVTETDAGNFGEDAADNFGGAAEAATGFEDNFGLGDQQLSAGTIPSPPTAPKKKEALPAAN